MGKEDSILQGVRVVCYNPVNVSKRTDKSYGKNNGSFYGAKEKHFFFFPSTLKKKFQVSNLGKTVQFLGLIKELLRHLLLGGIGSRYLAPIFPPCLLHST